MRHLRLNSLSVRQNVTYHCKDSHAFGNADGGKRNYLKLMSSDSVEMHKDAHFKNRPKVLKDGCHVRFFFFPQSAGNLNSIHNYHVKVDLYLVYNIHTLL